MQPWDVTAAAIFFVSCMFGDPANWQVHFNQALWIAFSHSVGSFLFGRHVEDGLWFDLVVLNLHDGFPIKLSRVLYELKIR